MTVLVRVAVTCEHPGCNQRDIVEAGPRPVSQVSALTLEARMTAQEAGWQVRRNHSGADLCPTHRKAAT